MSDPVQTDARSPEEQRYVELVEARQRFRNNPTDETLEEYLRQMRSYAECFLGKNWEEG